MRKTFQLSTDVFTHGCRNCILCDRSIAFSKVFWEWCFFNCFLVLRETFLNCWWKTSRRVVKTANYVSQEIFEEKMSSLTTWIVYIFLVPWAKLFWTFGGKVSAELLKVHCKDPEKIFERRCFLRRTEVLNFFGYQAK